MPSTATLGAQTRAYIGLGGNIGDVVATMASALRRIDAMDQAGVVAVSPVYRTPPWGMADQDWFHNCCACVDTRLSGEAFLEACLETETHFRRERIVRWGPRTLDIDILVFGEMVSEDERLRLPHPRIRERAFVLKPLSDLAPELPMDGKTVLQWLEVLDAGEPECVERNPDWWRER